MSFAAWLTVQRRGRLLVACCVAGAATGAQSQVRLGAPFGDHMVLPSDVPVTLWGNGCPGGDTLKLSIAGQSVVTRSDWQGNWMVRLAPMKAGGPFQLLIQIGGSGPLVPSSAANDHGGAEINDVLVGKLVVMQEAPAARNATSPLPRAYEHTSEHPFAEVRVFRPGESVETTYSARSSAQWVYARQDTLPRGTEPYFQGGRALQQKLHIPVGVIVTARGPDCSPAEACPAPAPVASVIPQPIPQPPTR